MPPPAVDVAELNAIVSRVTVVVFNGLSRTSSPPPVDAVLPVIVLSAIPRIRLACGLPNAAIPPPSPVGPAPAATTALLLSIRLRRIAAELPLSAMPPPRSALPPVTWTCAIASTLLFTRMFPPAPVVVPPSAIVRCSSVNVTGVSTPTWKIRKLLSPRIVVVAALAPLIATVPLIVSCPNCELST